MPVIWLQLQGFIEVGDGLVEIAPLQARIAASIVGMREMRVVVDRLVEVRNCWLNVSLRQLGVTAIIIGVVILWIQLQGA